MFDIFKVYKDSSDVVKVDIWARALAQMPPGCTLICIFRGETVLYADDEGVVRMLTLEG